MGRRLENWLAKANTPGTKSHWRMRFKKFAQWVTESHNLVCGPDEVDDVIRRDFEELPSHIFQDKYRDILSKYVASLSSMNENTASGRITSVRAFFSSEAMSITFQKGKLPRRQLARGEHRFTLPDLKAMWSIADFEGKARLSTALSLGWSIGDFRALETAFIRRILEYADVDGFVSFDYQRKKTKARVRGILNPQAVADLKTYLARVTDRQTRLWTTGTVVGFNKWIRATAKEAGVKPNGQIRFHLLRKYVYDVALSQIGPYEAKLLVGKTIPLEDETYLHGLEDRLLERYKKFAYPLLRLNGESQHRESKISDLEKRLESQGKALDYLQTENVDLKLRMRRLDALEADSASLKTQVEAMAKDQHARTESDEVMNRLFQDPVFIAMLKERLSQLQVAKPES